MDASHHRKIDLQSNSDLTYLHENIKQAAREKIDLAIPPSAAPAGEDAYRSKVEQLVNEYILQTLALALPSININGLDPSPSILPSLSTSIANTTTSTCASTSILAAVAAAAPSPTPSEISSNAYEPYDPRLAEKLRQLYATFDEESTKVAESRREAPGAAARAYRQAMEAELEREREMMGTMGGGGGGGGGGVVVTKREGEEEEAAGAKRNGGVESGLALGEGLARRDEVEKRWKTGVEGLDGLSGVTGVLARLERAQKALAVVEGANT